jgi:hypothetical protein
MEAYLVNTLFFYIKMRAFCLEYGCSAPVHCLFSIFGFFPILYLHTIYIFFWLSDKGNLKI